MADNWLTRQIEAATKEVASWPEWKQRWAREVMGSSARRLQSPADLPRTVGRRVMTDILKQLDRVKSYNVDGYHVSPETYYEYRKSRDKAVVEETREEAKRKQEGE